MASKKLGDASARPEPARKDEVEKV
jgi:hypothetical protein